MFTNADDDDDDVEEESLAKQVLPTADDQSGPVDLNKIPMTGEEYLRQVRYQASQLPDFHTALPKNPSRSKGSSSTTTKKKHAWHRLFNTTAAANSASSRHVSIEWQNEQCTAFSNLRQNYFYTRDQLRKTSKEYKMARMKNENQYWTFCFGPDIPLRTAPPNLEQNEPSALPTISKLITLTQPQLHELAQHLLDWIKLLGLSTHLALYLYATCVAIEKPMSEDVVYTLRQTCLTLKEIRTKLLTANDDPSLIKSCDLLICLIGRYFGQFDMADE